MRIYYLEIVTKEVDAVKARLMQHSSVAAVTAEGYPYAENWFRSSGNFDWEGRASNQMIDFVYAPVDFGFFETLGLTFLQGRPFSKDRPTGSQRHE
jgi:hypothetical protein